MIYFEDFWHINCVLSRAPRASSRMIRAPPARYYGAIYELFTCEVSEKAFLCSSGQPVLIYFEAKLVQFYLENVSVEKKSCM